MTLERLWAGWRTAYVESAAASPEGNGSPFTAILASGLPDTETSFARIRSVASAAIPCWIFANC